MDNASEVNARYGKIAHKILEECVISPDRLRAAASHNLLNLLPHEQKNRLAKSLTQIAKLEEFCNLLQGKILVEQAAGRLLEGGQVKTGRIDLLVIQKERIYIIDYKTDRQTPETEDEVNSAYRQQLTSYKNILSQIYPKHQIITQILWLEDPKLMEVNLSD